MAQKRKQPTKNPLPTGIHFIEDEGDFKLFKKWGRDKTAKEPYYITEDLGDLIEEIENSCNRWKCKVNLKEIKQFINKHNTGENEETNIPKSYFSQ